MIAMMAPGSPTTQLTIAIMSLFESPLPPFGAEVSAVVVVCCAPPDDVLEPEPDKDATETA